MEIKHLKFEIKLGPEDDGTFEGYAAVKGNVDSYGDIIQDGAFKRTIRGRKEFPILFMHDPSKPIGISVDMKEDQKGLYTKGRIDLSTELGRTAYSGLKLGYIDGLSIGYKVIKDDVNKRGNRLLKEIKLLEYSLITKGFAANELALVSGFKSIHDYETLLKRIEQLEGEKRTEEGGPPMDLTPVLEILEELQEEIKSIKEQLADSPEGTRPFFMPPDPDESTLEQKDSPQEEAQQPFVESEIKVDGDVLKALDELNKFLRGE